MDQLLLHHRNPFDRHLHAEIPARDHDAVGGAQDGADVTQRLGPLDLGDQRDPPARAAEDAARALEVRGALHERERDPVRLGARQEGERLPVGAGQRRDRDAQAGQVDPLVLVEQAASHHAAQHVAAAAAQHPEREPPVGQQHARPWPHQPREAAELHRDPLRGAEHGTGGEEAAGAGAQSQRAARAVRSGAELRAGEIGEHGEGAAEPPGDRAHHPDGARMPGEAAVCEVEPEDVRPRPDEALDGARRGGRRAQRRHDPGAGGPRAGEIHARPLESSITSSTSPASAV